MKPIICTINGCGNNNGKDGVIFGGIFFPKNGNDSSLTPQLIVPKVLDLSLSLTRHRLTIKWKTPTLDSLFRITGYKGRDWKSLS